MSSTTHNLPYKRYVAQVSTGVPRSKSTWLSLMAENLEALKACPWREAADVEVAKAIGCGMFVEFGPGKVLSGLVKKIDPALATANVADIASLDATVAALG